MEFSSGANGGALGKGGHTWKQHLLGIMEILENPRNCSSILLWLVRIRRAKTAAFNLISRCHGLFSKYPSLRAGAQEEPGQ